MILPNIQIQDINDTKVSGLVCLGVSFMSCICMFGSIIYILYLYAWEYHLCLVFVCLGVSFMSCICTKSEEEWRYWQDFVVYYIWNKENNDFPRHFIIHLLFIRHFQCPSWPWSCSSWMHNHLCNQCISPLKLGVRILLMARHTRYVHINTIIFPIFMLHF
jgi:hypothetical protein